jgi:acetylglutamate kinase
VEGLYRDFNDKDSLISSIKIDEVPALIRSGAIKKGMIPKLESCVHAIEGGVENVHIIDGRVPHSLLLELFTDSGVGTMLTKGE